MKESEGSHRSCNDFTIMIVTIPSQNTDRPSPMRALKWDIYTPQYPSHVNDVMVKYFHFLEHTISPTYNDYEQIIRPKTNSYHEKYREV